MRKVSNETIMNFIENEYNFNRDNIEKVIIYTMVFKDGRMGTTIHINDEFIDCDEDIIYVENDVIELQREIKELGSFLYFAYGIISKVETALFEGMKEEYVF